MEKKLKNFAKNMHISVDEEGHVYFGKHKTNWQMASNEKEIPAYWAIRRKDKTKRGEDIYLFVTTFNVTEGGYFLFGTNMIRDMDSRRLPSAKYLLMDSVMYMVENYFPFVDSELKIFEDDWKSEEEGKTMIQIFE